MVDLSDKEAFEMGLVENVHHKTMNPIEEALAFDRYSKDRGWGGITDLSKRIGKSQEFVTKRLQLLRLPQNIRDEIIRQRINPSVALELLPLNADGMQEFANFVIKNPLTKLEVRKIVLSTVIHGDIDTFLKLRKRLRMKIPRDYLNISKDNSHALEETGSVGSGNGDKLYHWATRGVWQ